MLPWTRNDLIWHLQNEAAPVEQRSAIAQRLRNCRHPRVEAALLNVLAGAWAVRRAAAESLLAQGWQPASKTEQAKVAVSLSRWDEVVSLGSSAVDPLIDALRSWEKLHDRDSPVDAMLSTLGVLKDPRSVDILVDISRKAADEALVQLGPQALDGLIRILKADKKWLRSKAARALGRIKNDRAAQALIESLDASGAMSDNNYELIEVVVEALGCQKDSRALPSLVRTLQASKYGNVTKAATQALVAIGDPTALKHLLGSKHMGTVAIGIGTNAVPALLQLAKAEHAGKARNDLVKALKELGWEPNSVEERVMYNLSIDGIKQWDNLGQDVIEELIRTYDTSEVEAQARVVRALGRLHADRAVDWLLQLLGRAPREIRVTVLIALGSIGGDRAHEALACVLRSDSDAGLRREAAGALKAIPLPAVQSALIGALSDTDYYVRRYALMGLIANDFSFEALVGALRNDSSSELRALSARIIGTFPLPKAKSALSAALLDSDAEVRYEAARLLSSFEPPESARAMDTLISLVTDDPNPMDEGHGTRKRVGPAAADLLGTIGNQRAVDSLRAAMASKNLELRLASAASLVMLGANDAISVLIDLLSHYEIAPSAAYRLHNVLETASSRFSIEQLHGLLDPHLNVLDYTDTGDWDTDSGMRIRESTPNPNFERVKVMAALELHHRK